MRAGEVDEKLVDAQVTRLLSVFDRLGALDGGDPGDDVSTDAPEHRAVARRAATESMVLLANDGLLPLDRAALRTVAIVGPNTASPDHGRGSASLRATHLVTPVEALTEALGEGVTVVHERGCDNRRNVPVLGGARHGRSRPRPAGSRRLVRQPRLAGEPVHHSHTPSADLVAFEPPVPGLAPGGWSLRAHTVVTPTESGPHEVTLTQAGRARVLVEGVTVLDGFTDPPPRGSAFFGMGSVEVGATVDLEAGRPVDVAVEFTTRAGREAGRPAHRLAGPRAGRPDGTGGGGRRGRGRGRGGGRDHRRVGVRGPRPHDDGPPRPPGRAGAPGPRRQPGHGRGGQRRRPRDDGLGAGGRALLQVWFGGQEMAGGLADVLLGEAEPAGRLPTTLPVLLEHNPSYGNFPGEAGHVRYGEGILVGYRWYQARKRRCGSPSATAGPTTWSWGEASLSSADMRPGTPLVVRVPVTNTGGRRGAEVVQCYVAPPPGAVVRAPRELGAFAKVWVEPGETATVELVLDDRAFAYWAPAAPDRDEVAARASHVPMTRTAGGAGGPGWRIDPGRYELHLGRSATEIHRVLAVEVATVPA